MHGRVQEAVGISDDEEVREHPAVSENQRETIRIVGDLKYWSRYDRLSRAHRSCEVDTLKAGGLLPSSPAGIHKVELEMRVSRAPLFGVVCDPKRDSHEVLSPFRQVARNGLGAHDREAQRAETTLLAGRHRGCLGSQRDSQQDGYIDNPDSDYPGKVSASLALFPATQ